MGQELFWIGHGSWRFTTASGTVIYVDPYINGNPACKLTMEDTRDAGIVCVTHGHDDHIGAGDAIDIAKAADKAVCQSPGYPTVYITFGDSNFPHHLERSLLE